MPLQFYILGINQYLSIQTIIYIGTSVDFRPKLWSGLFSNLKLFINANIDMFYALAKGGR